MKRRGIIALCIIVMVLGSLSAHAAEYDKTIEKFFSMLKTGKSTEAVDFLYSGNPWIGKASDAVQNVKSQLASLNKLVGQLKNQEKLQEVTVGSRFIYVSYLAAYERQPIRFEFEFYRPDDTWMIFSFSFDDKLDDDVEQAAKAKLVE